MHVLHITIFTKDGGVLFEPLDGGVLFEHFWLDWPPLIDAQFP